MARHGNKDICVIYYSAEDECWIAHSLRTDQIGTGDCALDALADLLLAVKQIQEEAKKDRSLVVWREAPAEIQRMLTKAKALPAEIYDIAHWKVHGDWPKQLEAHYTPPKRPRLKTPIRKPHGRTRRPVRREAATA